MEETISRRPLTSRNKTWAKRSAFWLKECGVRPNSISMASTFFAGQAAVFLYLSTTDSALSSFSSFSMRSLFLLCVIIGVLGRLICNLLDGMVAVEGGLKTASGEIFNDLPDRISDLIIFVAMGFAAVPNQTSHPEIWLQAGWAAASLAVLTAYIRYLGAGCGAGHFFIGPMAKQHRMAITIGATLSGILAEPLILPLGASYRIALILVIVGSLITCIRRTFKIIDTLESK